MKCRAIKNKNIVWFNSIGITGEESPVSEVVAINTIPDMNIQYFIREINNYTVGYLRDAQYKYIPIEYENIENPVQTANKYFILTNYGKDGIAIKYHNFDEKQQGVSSSLIQRLSILKKELWYNVIYGIPLLDKVSSKVIIDVAITSEIMEDKDVIKIISFESNIINKKYYCNINIETVYGNINIKS